MTADHRRRADTTLDVNLLDGHFYADGHAREAYRWMRENQPIYRDCNGIAALSTHGAVLEAERNPELFSNAGGIRPDHPPVPHMIDMDDPDHLRRRKLVNHGFTRKRLAALESSIHSICDTLIDAVADRGTADFVLDLAAPLPMAVIGDMLGILPQDRDMFLKWTDDLLNLSATASAEAANTMAQAWSSYCEYTLTMIAEKRAKPTDDLISVLVHAEIDGERLEDHQILAEVFLILTGGDETTRHTLSGGFEQLMRNPDQMQALKKHPPMLSSALEEMLRWTSPVKNMARTVTADNEFHGAALKKGEKVLLLFESANFDDRALDDPDVFRVNRSPNSHLAFGFGTHFCLGNQLARLELKLMTQRLLDRIPDMRLASDEALPLRPANFVSGLESMPIVFSPSTSRHHVPTT